jgi:hypothetical protein
VLLFQRERERGAEFAFTRRVSVQGRWSQPDLLPALNGLARGKPPTWPWTSDDGLLLIYCHGGDTTAEIWTATRTTKLEPFGDFRPLLVGGRPLLGRSPRYCAATGELFFSQYIGPQKWQLAVLKDFWPQGKPQIATSAAGGPPSGFTALFNGRDLQGWDVMQTSGSGASNQNVHFKGSGGWEVNNGVLKCTTAVRGWLKTQREFENFELHLDFILPAERNSGVYIRSPDVGHLSSVGMEVQIVEGDGSEPTGSIARASRGRDHQLRLPGQWNHMEIVCQGTRVQVSVNGVAVTDTDMSTNALLRDRPRKGYIGLANWMGQAQGMEFKNIFIKELPATSATPSTNTATRSQFNGHEYKYFPDVLSWKEARAKCVALGGDLVVIDSAEENWFVAQHIEAAGGIEAWFGATDQRVEGVWTTPTGARLSYTNWARGQPNNKGAGENFGVMIKSMNWAWSDQPDIAAQHRPGYVCEWEPSSSSTTSGWIELFNGRDLTGWRKADGSAAHWKVENGYIEIVPGGNIQTVNDYGPDFELEAEFWLPSLPQRTGQGRANSGIFLTGRHELQIVDAYNNSVGTPDRTCGAIYGEVAVTANAIRPPETWQTFYVKYQAPRWTTAGQLETAGRVSVTHNGINVITDDLLTSNGTAGTISARGSRGPIVLQDHGGAVRFRKLRIREL